MKIRKKYQMDLDKVINGTEIRTTLMIRNIPNKYSQKNVITNH